MAGVPAHPAVPDEQPSFPDMAGACDTLSHNFQLLGNHPEVQNQLNTAQAIQNLSNQMTQRFNDMNQDFTARLNQLTDQMTQRFNWVDQQFNGINQRFDGVDQRFDGIDHTIGGIRQMLDASETRRKAMVSNRLVLQTNAERLKNEKALEPLRSHLTNEIPDNFPATWGAITQMNGFNVDRLLQEFEQPTYGSLGDRKRRLRMTFGAKGSED